MNDIFVDTLCSENVRSKHQEELEPYKTFIGSWEFDWIGHQDDGSTYTVPGEWHFSWILEGRAIQDNWICPKRHLRSSGKYAEGEYGTTIRYYDFKEECIKVLWIGPILSNLNVFNVTHDKNQITQDEIMVIDNSRISRWVFKDIKEASFKWEAYVSNDNRKTWIMNQEVHAKRMIQKNKTG